MKRKNNVVLLACANDRHDYAGSGTDPHVSRVMAWPLVFVPVHAPYINSDPSQVLTGPACVVNHMAGYVGCPRQRAIA